MAATAGILARVGSVLGFGPKPQPARNFQPASNPLAKVNWQQKAIPAPLYGSGFGGTNGGRFSWAGGFSGYGYVAHEPFSGAWQRNITNANARDPNLLAFSGVYTCVTVISQDISAMKAQLLRLAADGVTEEVHTNSPYHKLLRKPNSYQHSMEFFQLYIVSRLLRGTVYVLQAFDARGVPYEWHLLHPDRTRPLVDPDTKEIFYEFIPHHSDLFTADAFKQADGRYVIPARFVIHDRINCLWHPLIGTSPLFAAAVSAMTGGRILMNTDSLFTNMSRPSGFLTSASTINDPTAERLKREWEANYSNTNIGRTAVLGDGLEWKSMVMTSTDAQLIEQLKWTIEDVARCFRVPMFLLNEITRMTYKNSEQASQAYYNGCLRYHIEEIEARLTTTFGLDDSVEYVAFDVRSMFRMDMQERFNAYRAGIAAGVLAPNEARKWEGLGPVKGGEEPRMQMQYVPLSTPVADPTAPAPTPAPAPKPPAGDGSGEKPAGDSADSNPENQQNNSLDEEDVETRTAEERQAAALEVMAIMKRVSAGAARARQVYEDHKYVDRSNE